MTQKLLSTITLLCLAVTSAWADDSGSCGTSVTYSYVESTHTLTISGTGAMADYTSSSEQPWKNYRSSITSIVIGGNVTSIGDFAFYDCYNQSLTSITIHASVTSIGRNAFGYCIGLTSITIPASVTSIGQNAFSFCYGLTSVTFASGSLLETIGESAFNNCTNLTSIEIPASVTSIGQSAFSDCSGLTSVTFASGSQLTTIGESAFYYCNNVNLTSITIPASVTSIGNSAFQFCTYLATVTVYAPSCTLGGNAFNGCNNLAKIYVPSDKVDTYKDATNWSAYKTKIEAITSNQSGNCGATGHESDVTWSYDNGILTITKVGSTGAMADYFTIDQPWKNYRSSITSIVIGSGVTSIGEYAFGYCTGLTSIEIPANVTSIGHIAFYKCTGLTSINVDADNPNYASEDGVLFNKAKTTIIQYPPGKSGTAYTIPASVTSIGTSAFAYCNKLTSIEIPASVTSIGNSAFDNCTGLTSITIPASVTSIDYNAFYECSNLATVTVYAPNCTLGGNAFKYCNHLAKIYVFSDRETYYQGAEKWSDYATKITAIPDLKVKDAGTAGKWCSYYNGLADVTVADGTTVYTAKYNSTTQKVTLTETGSLIIKKGEAVLLTASADITLSSAASSGTGTYTGNELKGTNTPTDASGMNKAYCLSYENTNGLGFYAFTGTIPANRAYLIIAPPSPARDFYGFGDENSKTAIQAVKTVGEDGEIYDLSGRRIVGQPRKGIYVKNGQKFIVK